MRTVRVRTSILTALAVAFFLASPVWAQKMKKADISQPPDVYRMEIYNGSARTVHYVTPSYLSPSETAMLREVERSENEIALNDTLFAVRMQYAVNEQALEAKRRTMQELLYGYNREENSTYAMGASGPAVGTGGMYYGGYPGLWGYGWGGNAWGGYAGYSGTTNHTLAVGAGMNEGAIKNELARSLASPMLTEQGALAYRNYQAALKRLEEYPRLAAIFDQPDVGVRRGSKAGFEPTSDVLYLKDGSAIGGKIVKEDADWVTIETMVDKAKRTEKVRMTEVIRISRPADAKKIGDDK